MPNRGQKTSMSELTPIDILDLRGADAAMQRLAADVRRIAAITGTPLATWKDGQLVLEPVSLMSIQPQFVDQLPYL